MIERRSALVSGAFSGIGLACARRLRAAGFRVWAGMLDEAQKSAFSGREGDDPELRPIVLDITDEASIAAARAKLLESDGGLDVLVNNAGIALAGPSEFLPLGLIRRQFEVNIIGHIAVTQAFTALLRQRKGRIVNIGSVSCRVSNIFLSPYAMSKHALKAWNDSLRMELHPWGIEVSLVEPGNVSTDIWKTAFAEIDKLSASMPPEGARLYGAMIATMRRTMADKVTDAMPAEAVAERVFHAATARRPRTHYPIGADRRRKILLSALLSPRAYDRFVRRFLGLDKLPAPGKEGGS